MSMEHLGRALCRMLEDRKFAVSILEGDSSSLKEYDLTQEESAALTTRVEAWKLEPVQAVPSVGAWKLIAQHLESLSPDLRRKLNEALARHSGSARAIPVTGG